MESRIIPEKLCRTEHIPGSHPVYSSSKRSKAWIEDSAEQPAPRQIACWQYSAENRILLHILIVVSSGHVALHARVELSFGRSCARIGVVALVE